MLAYRHRPSHSSAAANSVMTAIADQLAEVVLCVNGIVEHLEREEEQQELDFFQTEREAIEQEFEQRLAELREQLMAHAHLAQAPQHLQVPQQTQQYQPQPQPTPQQQIQQQPQQSAPPTLHQQPPPSQPQSQPQAQPLPQSQPQPYQSLPQQHSPSPSQPPQQQAHPFPVARPFPQVAPQVPSKAPPAAATAAAQPQKAISRLAPSNPSAPVPRARTPSAQITAATATATAAIPAAAASASIPPSSIAASASAAVPAVSASPSAFTATPAVAAPAPAAAVPSSAAAAAGVTILFGSPPNTVSSVWSVEDVSECLALRDALATTQPQSRELALPYVQPRAAVMVQACINRRRKCRLQAQRQQQQQGATEENKTEDIVLVGDLPSVCSACNALGLGWLFALLAARLSFARGAGDLAFLHGLMASSSAWTRLNVGDALQTQRELILGSSPAPHPSPVPAAASASAANGRSAIAAAAAPSRTGVEHPESLKAVLNMHWFQRVAASFPSSYKPHLKRRAALLLPLTPSSSSTSTTTSTQLQTCPWLEAAEGGILWCRIYCELLFAQQLLQLAAAPTPAAPAAPTASASAVTMDEALALWNRACYLPQVLFLDFSVLSLAAHRRRGAELLGVLVCSVAPTLGGLGVTHAALEPRTLLEVLAAAPNLAHLHLQAVLPFTSPASIEPLQLKQRFPGLSKITVE